MATLKLKRIAPGLYETTDGLYEVHGFQRPERCGYGPAGQWRWYWREVQGGSVDDHYDTKREALAALAEWLQK